MFLFHKMEIGKNYRAFRYVSTSGNNVEEAMFWEVSYVGPF